MSLFDFGSIGIDLGTANVRIYVKDKGIVLNEPTVVSVDRMSGKILAVGEDARLMLGRTPENIVAVRPLKDGVIASFHDAERMLRYFLSKVLDKRIFFKPNAVVCVPSGVTEVEKRAVIEVSQDAGIHHAFLMEEPVAAAIGAGLDVSAAYGNTVIDIGAGTTDVAIFSLGSIVISNSSKIAGNAFDEAIINYLRRRFDIVIGESTAEQIKINIGAAMEQADNKKVHINAKSHITGLPKTISISTNELAEAIKEPLDSLIDMLLSFFEQVPPELSADIYGSGICITGGGALLRGIDSLITQKTGLECMIAEDPMACVAIGAGAAAENIDLYSNCMAIDYRKGEYY